MADYFAIPDSALDPDAPVTSELAYALRDNPIAIVEGAAGAPRIQDGALGGNATPYGGSWIAARTSFVGAGAVGSYVFAVRSSAGETPLGGIVSGASLNASNVATEFGVALSGSWRCMGFASGTVGAGSTTLWLRVS